MPFWEFSGVVPHGLVNLFGLYTVQFGDIAIEDDLLVSQGDDLLFYLGKQISVHSIKKCIFLPC